MVTGKKNYFLHQKSQYNRTENLKKICHGQCNNPTFHDLLFILFVTLALNHEKENLTP